MAHISSQFIKELPKDNFSDGSDVSELNPLDLAKVLKSASELDDEIFGFKMGDEKEVPPSKVTASGKLFPKGKTSLPSRRAISPGFDDPLADLSFSDEEKIFPPPKSTFSAPQIAPKPQPTKPVREDGSKVTSTAKLEELFKLDDLEVGPEDRKGEVEKRRQGADRSADWLGLKESPKPTPGKSPDKTLPDFSLNKQVDTTNKESGDYGVSRSRSAQSVSRQSTAPLRSRTAPSLPKKNLLAEIFGEDEDKEIPPVVKKQEAQVEPKRALFEPSKVDEVKSGGGYEPSSGGTRRPARRQPIPTPSQPPSLALDSELNWLLAPKPKPVASQQVQKVSLEGDSGLPEWLGGKQTSLRKTDSFISPTKAVEPKQPDAKKHEPAVEKIEDKGDTIQEIQVESANETIPPSGVIGGDVSVVGQLAIAQSQLGTAMARHHNNLYRYMKELITEAERVEGPRPVLTKGNSQDLDGKPDKIRDEEEEESIHRLKVTLKRMEMDNLQLEMKIENLHSLHESQIENNNKAHEYEIKVWEARVERLKHLSSDLEEEYSGKLTKLKAHEDELVKSYKQRIETLQEERLEDLKRLGDFHRLALEQAASLTVFYPHGRAGSVRLPLRLAEKPSDEGELSDREKALIEKERHLDMMKAELGGLRDELEEEMERERMRKEEREGEMRRTLAEAKLREDMLNREMDHERRHLDTMRAQLERLKESAMKEHSDLISEKLNLAAEKARLDTASKLNGSNLSPIDVIQAHTEVEAALEAARKAQDAGEAERRKNIEERRTVEAIAWEQKAKDQQLDNREKQIHNMIQEAEEKREEGLRALEEAKKLEKEVLLKEEGLKKQKEQLEFEEKSLVKERMELAKERLELEKKKAQLELVLPELTPNELFTLNPPRNFVDPKLLIMKLRAEKELNSYSVPKSKLT